VQTELLCDQSRGNAIEQQSGCDVQGPRREAMSPRDPIQRLSGDEHA
jgi:hypothetical protein